MKFFSKQFPNLSVVGGRYDIHFLNGVYETDNKDIQEFLVNCGFPFISTEPAKEISAITHTIPKRWTVEQITEYAKEHSIEFPEEVTTKKEMIDYIESL